MKLKIKLLGVILADDHKQLPPTVLNQEAEEKGLSGSLLDTRNLNISKKSRGDSNSYENMMEAELVDESANCS